jgi:hypothetical protein
VLAATAGNALAQAGWPAARPAAGDSQARAVAGLGDLNAMLDPATRAALAPEQARLLADALTGGLQAAFWLYLAAAIAGLVVVALLPRGRIVAAPEASQGAVPSETASAARTGE